MEIGYKQCFPGLMAGKKIMYVHGFCSSAQSGTVTLLRSILPDAEVVAFDLPLRPTEALDLLHEKCEQERPDLIIGTSMGGMFAEMLYGYDRILVNPAFEMGSTMKEHNMMGKQTFFNPRQDGVQEFIVTKELVKEYREMTAQCFSGAHDEAEQQRVFGLFGMEDPLVHTYDLFRSHYPNAIRFHGEHRMTDHIVINSIVPVVRWIDDRQEKRQREVVYVDLSALRLRDELRPSANKAIALMSEFYNVRFVCPALTAEPSAATRDLLWMEDKIGAHAYNRVTLTSTPELLYGDYLITARKPSSDGSATEFLGTVLEFGSDQFKTWDDLITYFARLNNI